MTAGVQRNRGEPLSIENSTSYGPQQKKKGGGRPGDALRMSAAESGPPIIARIAPDSAAAKSSKVRCGDMLAAVNGVGTGGMELQKVEHMLRAPAVCLTLMRARGDADEAANPGGRSATGRTARLRKAVVAPLLTEMVSLPTVGARRHDSVGSEPRPGGRTDMVGGLNGWGGCYCVGLSC